MNDSNPLTVKNIPIIEMKGIYKRFPGVLANENVDFKVYKSEIHALLGENGAGKSTDEIRMVSTRSTREASF